MDWTERQKEAIYDRGNSLLVSAAAGSGKTAVLVERIKTLLTESGESLDRMLIVTFTKAAAAEMRERLRKKLGEALAEAEDEKERKHIKRQLSLIGTADICTFDSFAQKIVRSYYYITGIDPGLKVCDNYRSAILKDEAMDELFTAAYAGKDPSFTAFLDRYSNARTDRNARELILKLYEYTDTLPDPDAFLEDPEFSPERLISLAGEFAMSSLKRSLSYAKLLKDLFEMHEMPKCLLIAQTVFSDLDSMTAQIEGGYAEEAMERMCSYRFPTLAAGSKEEKEKKKELDDTVKAYWDKGAKASLKDFSDAYEGISLSRLEDEKERIREYVKELCFLTKEFSAKYGEKKRKDGLMDFSDGEHFAYEILKNDEVRNECREKYRHIFVDEYQDCNPVQEGLIESISSGNNVFTVGDVKQSIYRFRHAEPGLFLARYNEYRKGKEDCKALDLSSNFRSSPLIIDFVNRLFSNLMTEESCGMSYGEDAALKEGMPYAGTPDTLYEPELYLVDTQIDDDMDPEISDLKNTELEALNAAEVIKKYHDGGHMIYDGGEKKPIEYRDMVILLRSAKVKAEIYYDILTKAGVPVHLDRSEGYFDTPEIQILVNLLRVIDNPRQDVPLISVLYFPSFGFSAEELARIRIEARSAEQRKQSFYDAFIYVSKKEGEELSLKCRKALERLDAWRIKASALPLADFLWELLSESGIYVFASGLSSGEQRAANLTALVDKAAEFEKTSSGGIFAFISYIDVISDEKSRINTGQSSIASEEDDVVRIMTVHKSKGLEFPFVLFASCGGRMAGGRDSLRAAFHKDLGTSMVIANPDTYTYTRPLSYRLIEAQKRKEELAEEIRILYVAVTRARDVFLMSASDKDARAMEEKREVFRIKGADCSNFAQMSLPAFREDKVKIKERGDFSAALLDSASEYGIRLKEALGKGFEIDRSKLSVAEDEIRRRLSFDYSPAEAEKEKKKFSVSELAASQREKSGTVYAAEEKDMPVPAFLSGKQKLSAAAVGTAYHKIMEHIPFGCEYEDEGKVHEYMDRLLEKGILSEDEYLSVKPDRIAGFFRSAVGKRVCNADVLKKESPFVMKHILDGRTVLVQGTIDCWFEEEGKIYLLDYKSSYVDLKDREKELARLEDEYRPQLKLYREALETVSGKKVEDSYLYLFASGDCISI